MASGGEIARKLPEKPWKTPLEGLFLAGTPLYGGFFLYIPPVFWFSSTPECI
jgi:hypothetical protein